MPAVCQRDIMVVAPNFVVAYGKLFDFLCRQGGTEEVKNFCILFSDCIAKEITEKIQARGLSGAFEHWGFTLPREGATCKITLDVKEGLQVLDIQMYNCPSVKQLDTPNKLYCSHCDTLYRRILEQLGYDFYINFNGLGQCHLTMSERAR